MGGVRNFLWSFVLNLNFCSVNLIETWLQKGLLVKILTNNEQNICYYRVRVNKNQVQQCIYLIQPLIYALVNVKININKNI